MKRIIIILILVILAASAFSQSSLSDHIHHLQGIWIAEDFLNSFNQTRSSVKSLDAFSPINPVGLRINTKEIKNDIISIGYAELHDHLLHPEVSGYCVKGNDTLYEQGRFEMNLMDADSMHYYKTTYGNYILMNPGKGYFSWKTGRDITLILYLPAEEDRKAYTILYKRIATSFSEDYPFPNPLYYYTRSKTLVGNYVLKDSLDRVVSNNFSIAPNGIASGYERFEGKQFDFSTDNYCGPPSYDDYVIISNLVDEDDYDGYAYRRINKKTICFYRRLSDTFTKDEEIYGKAGKLMYTLIRK